MYRRGPREAALCLVKACGDRWKGERRSTSPDLEVSVSIIFACTTRPGAPVAEHHSRLAC